MIPQKYLFGGEVLFINLTVVNWVSQETKASTTLSILKDLGVNVYFPYDPPWIYLRNPSPMGLILEAYYATCANLSSTNTSVMENITALEGNFSITSGTSFYAPYISSYPNLSGSMSSAYLKIKNILLLNNTKVFPDTDFIPKNYYLVTSPMGIPAKSNVTLWNFSMMYFVDTPSVRLNIINSNKVFGSNQEVFLQAKIQYSSYLDQRVLSSCAWRPLSCVSMDSNTNCDGDSILAGIDLTKTYLQIPAAIMPESVNLTVSATCTLNDGSTSNDLYGVASVYSIASKTIYTSVKVLKKGLSAIYYALEFYVAGSDASITNIEWKQVAVRNLTSGATLYTIKNTYLQQFYALLGYPILNNNTDDDEIPSKYLLPILIDSSKKAMAVEFMPDKTPKESIFIDNLAYDFAVRMKDSLNNNYTMSFFTIAPSLEYSSSQRRLMISPDIGFGLDTKFHLKIITEDVSGYDDAYYQLLINLCPSIDDYVTISPPVPYLKYYKLILPGNACGSSVSIKLRCIIPGALFYKDYGPFSVNVLDQYNETASEKILLKCYEDLSTKIKMKIINPVEYLASASVILLSIEGSSSDKIDNIVNDLLTTFNSQFMNNLLIYSNPELILHQASFFCDMISRGVNKNINKITLNTSKTLIESLYNISKYIMTSNTSMKADCNAVNFAGYSKILIESMNTIAILINKIGIQNIDQQNKILELLKITGETHLSDQLTSSTKTTFMNTSNFIEMQSMKVLLEDIVEAVTWPENRRRLESNNLASFLLSLPPEWLYQLLNKSNEVNSGETYIVGIVVSSIKNLKWQVQQDSQNNDYSTTLMDIGIYKTLSYRNGTQSQLIPLGLPDNCTSNISMKIDLNMKNPRNSDNGSPKIMHFNSTSNTWETGLCELVEILDNGKALINCWPNPEIGRTIRMFGVAGVSDGKADDKSMGIFKIYHLNELNNNVRFIDFNFKKSEQ